MPRPAVLAVVAVQVAVPLAMLGARWAAEGSRPVTERPASFQMYSSTAAPTYAGRTADGALRLLDADVLPPLLRAVGSGRLVPDRLCARHPDVVAVVRRGGPDPGAFAC